MARPSNGIIWPTHKRKASNRSRTRKFTARKAHGTTPPSTSVATP